MNEHSPAGCNRQRRSIIALFALSFGTATPLALGQAAYPVKPIRIIVGASPGGGTDALARVWADAAGVLLKQQVIVDNRAGANGVIGSEALVRSPADGYTLAIVQNTHTVNPAIVRKLPYDTFRDFVPIGPLARSPLVFVASAATGVKSLKDLTELAQRDPKSMSFGSPEASIRMATEMIRGATRIPLTVVPYKGTGPVVTDIAGGHLNFAVTTIASTLPYTASGKVNYLGVLAQERSPFLPDVATLAEQGVVNIQASGWWGLVGPANLPKDVVQKLNAAIVATLADPEVKKKFAALAVEPWTESPETFDKFIRNEVALTTKVARQAGIEPE